MTGSVAIGVAGPDTTEWLEIDLGGPARCVLSHQKPTRAKAFLLLGVLESASLLEGSLELSADSKVVISGDEALLRRFVERYLAKRTPLSLRSTRPW